ncbi:MAG: FAD-binding protein [Chitinivibrionales bacterium]|nr:FAD-binding protein [Chitinivibrionales bacterium]MBD3394919.1 FAD-binding protein [Chitinivibrionales bacterium]
MKTEKHYDAVVIGAGAAGMAAACAVCERGLQVALVDREEHLGGILLQCIHNGFGLHHFKEELTGPEYAGRCIERVLSLPIDIYLETTVVDIAPEVESRTVHAYSGRHGVLEFHARAIVLAMGCRERNRGNIGIPGLRPSGILTAGLAQRLLNIDGYMPGKKVVIVGSGDIGLIMARRLTWTGARVRCVVEILPCPSGLTRNIVQCLQDFSIPLHLSHAVTRIRGTDRVEAVEISPLHNGVPRARKAFTVECDTLLLSVGLIPENELSRRAGIAISPDTNGAEVDHRLQTSVEGIFACGNVLHVHDLVDYVSEEAETCGGNVAAYIHHGRDTRATAPVEAGANLKYVLPNRCAPGETTRLLMRALAAHDRAKLVIQQQGAEVVRRALKHVRPAEMISCSLSERETAALRPDVPVQCTLET